jgi:hypothetical protein
MRTLVVLCLMMMFGVTSLAADLDGLVHRAVRETREQFAEHKVDDDALAVTVIDMRDRPQPRTGSFRGTEPIFPASVVKLFYLAATHDALEGGQLQDSEELRRTMRDMIVTSSNDATGMIVDALAGVPNGEPLPEEQMQQWSHKRHAVNRYFAGLGYTGINVCQKTYCEGPYGRERIFIGEKFENRNKLTTDATAQLMREIVLEQSVTSARSKEMMTLLQRDLKSNDSQARDFIGKALPAGSKLWSKAGWTSTARHDAAYIETPDGVKAIIVIFSTGHSRQQELVPTIAGKIINGLQQPGE